MDPYQLQQIGPYPVKRFIAEGGMAWVFHVRAYRFQDRQRDVAYSTMRCPKTRPSSWPGRSGTKASPAIA